MIERQELALGNGNPIRLGTSATIGVLRCCASRPADIFINSESGDIELASFAEQSFASDVGGLVPTCEVVFWMNYVFVLGLPALIIIGRNAMTKYELFRKPTDDTGFYHIDWVETADRIFASTRAEYLPSVWKVRCNGTQQSTGTIRS